LVLAATLITAGLPNPRLFAVAAPGARQKISADLARRVDDHRGVDRVNIIVQFNNTPATVIDRVLANAGARVSGRLNAINMRVLELPVVAVVALSSQKEVRFISADRPIANLGHVETTTGIEAGRVQTTTTLGGLITTTNVYDG